MNLLKPLSKVAKSLGIGGKATLNPRGWEMLWGTLQKIGWASASELMGPLSVQEKERAYASHPIIKACAEIISTTLTKPRLEIGRWQGNDWKALPSHDMLNLLRFPNPEYDRGSIFEYLITRTGLTGVGYIQIIRNKGGNRLAQLWPLPTSWVNPIFAEAGQGYLFKGYKIYGQAQIVPRENMVVLRRLDPASMVGSVGAMDAASKEYQLDLGRSDYQAEALENLKIPGLVVVPKTTFTTEQRRELKQDIEGNYGKGNRFRVMVVEGPDGADIKVINPLSDMDWPGMTSLSETRICASWRVPPIIVGSRFGLERATYSNYRLAKEAFLELTMVSWWTNVQSALTFGLLLRQGVFDLEFRFRYDELPEFQENRTELSTRTRGEFKDGIISREEARAMLGYKPDPQNDMIISPSSSGGSADQGNQDNQGNQGGQNQGGKTNLIEFITAKEEGGSI